MQEHYNINSKNSNPTSTQILEALAAGKDPVSGEAFVGYEILQRPDVIQAFLWGARALRLAPKAANAGLPWRSHEVERLREEFRINVSIADMAEAHGRTYEAIRSRLIQIGLIKLEEGRA